MGTSRPIISFSCWYSRAASHAFHQPCVIVVSRLVKGPAYGQILQGSRVEYSSSCFSIADVFGLTKPSIEFFVLHPSQPSTRAAWRRRVATRSRPASPASYRTELRDLAAAGCRVTACIEEELDLGAAGQHSQQTLGRGVAHVAASAPRPVRARSGDLRHGAYGSGPRLANRQIFLRPFMRFLP
ncbi:hypothetical protein B0J13DRAFT_252658 [Dactylonectria estremocensis]|uniref:Uncharacterized protein n=1 Tax=Dactylonectria estremocensis TaxID=1079267 RepID=A0A9P9J776_9HYPO|nr:hypothetical protein B0J13DRAFT_252658 [Dactylonectria estremocensis]